MNRPESFSAMGRCKLSGDSTSAEKSSALPGSMRRSISRTGNQFWNSFCAAWTGAAHVSASAYPMTRSGLEKEILFAEKPIDRIPFGLRKRFVAQRQCDVEQPRKDCGAENVDGVKSGGLQQC